MKTEIYQRVTDRIAAMLEAGTKPWQQPWSGGPQIVGTLDRPLRSNGIGYTGINVLNLWCAAQVRGFKSRYWFTYKSAQEYGGQVRKGAKAELAFYVGQMKKPSETPDAEDESISFLKSYHVFNGDEIDGLPARFAPIESPVLMPESSHERRPEIDAFFANAGMKLTHGFDKAYYMPSRDETRLPELARFRDAESYYCTLAHEAIHFTGHASRCDREFGKRYGDNAYAVEELVAELGSAFLCADLAISASPRTEHADYMAHWIKILKADNRAIFTAAGAAERACKWLHDAQPAAEMNMAA